MGDPMPSRPISGVLNPSLLRRTHHEQVIESSYRQLTGRLMNLQLDPSSNTEGSSDGAESIIGDSVESDEEDEEDGVIVAANRSRGTSQAIEQMAAMSLGVPGSAVAPSPAPAVATPATASHGYNLRSRDAGATSAEPSSDAIEQKMHTFLKMLKQMQRGAVDGCVSISELHIAVSNKEPNHLELLDVERPTEYIVKAQRYLNIVLSKFVGTMPYIKLLDSQKPWFVRARDNVPSWKEQKAMARNPPPSKATKADKLFPLIDVLLHCVPRYQLLGNGQLKRCLHQYDVNIVKSKVDLIYYCEEATKHCNICVHLIWGGGYCISLREPEKPFKDDDINRRYLARSLPSRFNAEEIKSNALRR